MARYDDLNTRMIAYATVLSVVILIIILQGTQALCYTMVNFERERKDTKIIDAASTIKSEQLESLNGFNRVEVVDEAAESKKGEAQPMKKVIRIPVSDAQKIILKDFSPNAGA